MKLSLWTTNDCNMRCRYCYEAKPCEIMYMSLDIIPDIIFFIQQIINETNPRNIYVKFFGGEPLLNFSFVKEFTYAIRHFMTKYNIPLNLSITTNGTLLNSDIVNFFKENNIECSLSIDGTPDTQRKNRKLKDGNDSWFQVSKHLITLQKAKMNLNARVTFNSSTVSNLANSVKFLYKIGFNTIKVVPDFFDPTWSENDVQTLKNQLVSIDDFKETTENINIILDNLKITKGYIGCGGGYNIFSITPNGDIYPCTYAAEFPIFKIGNIHEPDNIKISRHKTNNNKRESCKNCKYFYCCKSGYCIYSNYKTSGDFYKPSGFFCEYQKIMYQSINK